MRENRKCHDQMLAHFAPGAHNAQNPRMAIALALLSALVYGAADFAGGIATKRSGPTLPVVVYSQLAGWVLVIGLIPLMPVAHPKPADFLWGLAGGVAGSAGLMFFYRGLARGVMSVVSPVAAAVSAIVPMVFGLASGDSPAALAIVGAMLGVVACGLLGSQPTASHHDTHDTRLRSFAGATMAGVGFGGFFVLLHHTSSHAGLWPLFSARLGSATLLTTIALARRHPPRLARPAVRMTIIAGVFDMGANALYLLATHRGLLSLVGVIAALYPASTLVLARTVLKERVSPLQFAALVLAGISVSLIAVA